MKQLLLSRPNTNCLSSPQKVYILGERKGDGDEKRERKINREKREKRREKERKRGEKKRIAVKRNRKYIESKKERKDKRGETIVGQKREKVKGDRAEG